MLSELVVYYNARVLTETAAVAITDAGVETDQGETVAADTIVIATGTKPEASLYDGLVGSGVEIYEIGDATGARTNAEGYAYLYYDLYDEKHLPSSLHSIEMWPSIPGGHVSNEEIIPKERSVWQFEL